MTPIRKPTKVFKDFFLYVDHFTDGEVKKIHQKEITRPITLPKWVQDSYRDRFGDEYSDYYFYPIGPIGVVTKGGIITKGRDEIGVALPGRDFGHAVFTKDPNLIHNYEYKAVGPITEYHCLVPRKIKYYCRKLYHNIQNLPNEMGYNPPTVGFTIPEKPYDQFLYVASGMLVTKVGSGYSERSLLKIPANSGDRPVALPWPNTSIVHIWIDPEDDPNFSEDESKED